MLFHRDEWQELKANLHDFDDLLINDAEIDSLKSLSVDNEKVFFSTQNFQMLCHFGFL